MTQVLASIAFALVALLAAAGGVFAQGETGPAGTASVQGRVTAADTGRPLRRAQITLTGLDALTERRSANTDSEGRYELTEVPAGRYTVSVTRSGYLSLRYGQRRPLEPGRPLQISDGQTLESIDFTLPRASVISGRIADELGEPMPGVIVVPMRPFFYEGRRQLRPATGELRTTDDAGRYRLYGLVPGAYAVMAMTRDTWTVHTSGEPQVTAFQPTYFPGTAVAGQAGRIAVGVGQSVDNADFSLVPGRAATVSGTAFDAQGRPLERVSLGTEIRSPLGVGAAMFSGRPVTVGADGAFTFRDVAPGEYVIRASAAGAIPETAVVPVVVDGGDVENVVVVTSAGWSVAGTILTESGAPPAFPAAELRLSGLVLSRGTPAMGRGTVREDWAFSIENLMGPARVQVDPPEGWMLKAVWHEGREITDAAVEMGSGETLSGLEIVLTDRVTVLAGRLVAAAGAPATDGIVIVYADDEDKWFEGSRFVRVTRLDQRGEWQVRGLPPGRYLAAAVETIEEGMWHDPEYLDALRPHAQELTVSEGSSQTIALTLVNP
jgi:protocatechuate 3,4-dioxygenase beta subunit